MDLILSYKFATMIFVAKTKFQEYFEKMLATEKQLFDKFKDLHARYALDEDGLQEEFNSLGEKVIVVIHEWEDRLCKNTERGMYNKYSSNLAEKFQKEVRASFPLIDKVGLSLKKPKRFAFKKIDLE